MIKTVIRPIEKAGLFDDAVNELIENGWTLTKREVINTQGTITESFNIPVIKMLYAELEK